MLKKVLLFSCLIFLVGFLSSCVSAEVVPEEQVEKEEPKKIEFTGYRGYRVGDLILNDGSFISYNNVANMSDEEKANAVAVICGFDYAGNPIGMGLKFESLEWCERNPIEIPEIEFEPEDEYNAFTVFSGDVDGSDNWEFICASDPDALNDVNVKYEDFIKNYGSGRFDYSNRSDVHIKYPACYFANNYGVVNNFSDVYSSGWYIPTVAELFEIYKNQDAINEVIKAVTGNELEKVYLSSNYKQKSGSGRRRVWAVYLSDNRDTIQSIYRDSRATVCCIHKIDNKNEVVTEKPRFKIGDALLNDNTFVPYEIVERMTAEEKAKVFAVIADINKDGVISALGLDSEELAWSYRWEKFPEIECNVKKVSGASIIPGTKDRPEYDFVDGSDLDGSDNWAVICHTDREGVSANKYPAFEFANTYGSRNNLSEDYSLGWYIPSCYELRDLSRNIANINRSLKILIDNPLRERCWSSSCNNEGNEGTKAWYGDFRYKYYRYNFVGTSFKDGSGRVLCFRKF